ncbi:hypothetical protein K488DRAFT_49240, partial [Vararia minispora EC-137]
LAILTQFSCFVGARAEELRDRFTAHDGKHTVYIETADAAVMTSKMPTEMDKHLTDPSLRQWILPCFSTTTPDDTNVCSIIIMATLKSCFGFFFGIACGIPRVTLDGTKDDWEENIDFWARVLHYRIGGCGDQFVLSGWITAFCVFDAKGRWIGPPPREASKHTFTPQSALNSVHGRHSRTVTHASSYGEQLESTVLDGIHYNILDTIAIPNSLAEVNVEFHDDSLVYNMTMVAGTVVVRVLDSGGETLSKDGKHDTAAPMPGCQWWIYSRLLT